MRKGLAGALMLSGALFILNSCKDDPDPISSISFEKATEEINESDGTTKSFSPLVVSGGTGQEIKVKVLLDKPAPDNLVLSYTVSGTAGKVIDSSTGEVNDFNLNGANAKDTETMIVEKGATEAFITLTIYEDRVFEVDDDDNPFETIVLTFDKVVSGPAVLGETNKEYQLKIYEDDMGIALQWDKTTADVDMDIWVWLDGKVVLAAPYADFDYEFVSIPGGYPNGSYGISYTYYGGSSDNLKFAAYLFGRSVNNKEYITAPLAFNGTYKLANVNKYDKNATAPAVKIIQTVVKTKFNYVPNNLDIPASGSKISSSGSRLSIPGITEIKAGLRRR